MRKTIIFPVMAALLLVGAGCQEPEQRGAMGMPAVEKPAESAPESGTAEKPKTEGDVIDIAATDHNCKRAISQCNICSWEAPGTDLAACTMAFCEDEQYECVEYFQDKPSLTSGDWKWVRMETKHGYVTTPEKDDAFSLTFQGDGAVNGTTDCNRFFSTYETDGVSLSFGPLGSTKMFCKDSQELSFTRALGETESYEITDEGQLVLKLKVNAGTMTFEQ